MVLSGLQGEGRFWHDTIPSRGQVFTPIVFRVLTVVYCTIFNPFQLQSRSGKISCRYTEIQWAVGTATRSQVSIMSCYVYWVVLSISCTSHVYRAYSWSVMTYLPLTWLNQLRLSAMRWLFSHPSHCTITIPFSYACLVNVFVWRWLQTLQVNWMASLRSRLPSACVSRPSVDSSTVLLSFCKVPADVDRNLLRLISRCRYWDWSPPLVKVAAFLLFSASVHSLAVCDKVMNPPHLNGKNICVVRHCSSVLLVVDCFPKTDLLITLRMFLVEVAMSVCSKSVSKTAKLC